MFYGNRIFNIYIYPFIYVSIYILFVTQNIDNNRHYIRITIRIIFVYLRYVDEFWFFDIFFRWMKIPYEFYNRTKCLYQNIWKYTKFSVISHMIWEKRKIFTSDDDLFMNYKHQDLCKSFVFIGNCRLIIHI